MYIGLKSPITAEEKYFISSANSWGSSAKIRSAVETGREETHFPARHGLVPAKEAWRYQIFLTMKLEDLTEYKTHISVSSGANVHSAKKSAEEIKKQLSDLVNYGAGLIEFDFSNSMWNAVKPIQLYFGKISGISYTFELTGPFRRFSDVKNGADTSQFYVFPATTSIGQKKRFYFMDFASLAQFHIVGDDRDFYGNTILKFIKSYYNQAGMSEFLFEDPSHKQIVMHFASKKIS